MYLFKSSLSVALVLGKPFFIFYLSRLRLASFDSRGKLVCSRSTGYQLLTLEKDQVRDMLSIKMAADVNVSIVTSLCCMFAWYSSFSFQPFRSMWWWTWTAACYHSPSTCAVTSCIHHPSRTTVQIPQNKKALLAVCLDACPTATIPLVTLTQTCMYNPLPYLTPFPHWTSSACSISQWGVMGKCFVSMYSVFFDTFWVIYTWRLQRDRDTSQWPGRTRPPFAFITFTSPWISDIISQHWDVGPFIKMEKLQFMWDGGNLLETLHRILNNGYRMFRPWKHLTLHLC